MTNVNTNERENYILNQMCTWLWIKVMPKYQLLCIAFSAIIFLRLLSFPTSVSRCTSLSLSLTHTDTQSGLGTRGKKYFYGARMWSSFTVSMESIPHPPKKISYVTITHKSGMHHNIDVSHWCFLGQKHHRKISWLVLRK